MLQGHGSGGRDGKVAAGDVVVVVSGRLESPQDGCSAGAGGGDPGPAEAALGPRWGSTGESWRRHGQRCVQEGAQPGPAPGDPGQVAGGQGRAPHIPVQLGRPWLSRPSTPASPQAARGQPAGVGGGGGASWEPR